MNIPASAKLQKSRLTICGRRGVGDQKQGRKEQERIRRRQREEAAAAIKAITAA